MNRRKTVLLLLPTILLITALLAEAQQPKVDQVRNREWQQ
jgi:hypothetical protein